MEERYDAFPFFLLFFLPAVVAVDSILEQKCFF